MKELIFVYASIMTTPENLKTIQKIIFSSFLIQKSEIRAQNLITSLNWKNKNLAPERNFCFLFLSWISECRLTEKK